MKKNSSVTRLSLSHNNIQIANPLARSLVNKNSENVEFFKEALKRNLTLTKLESNNNRIKNVESIGKALETNRILTELELYLNQIVDVNSIVNYENLFGKKRLLKFLLFYTLIG